MEITSPDPRILLQHETTCKSKRSSAISPNGIQPHFHPYLLPNHEYSATQGQLLLLQKAREEANAAHELARQKMMERIM